MKSRLFAVIRSLVVAAVLLAPLIGLHRWQAGLPFASSPQPVGAISGQAEVLHTGSADWQAVTEDAVYTGDSIRAVADVRLTLLDGTILDLDPGARVVVRRATPGEATVVVLQEAGRLRVDTSNPAFRLEAPGVALNVDKAVFRVEVNGPGDAYVSADRGVVYGNAGGENLRVTEGEVVRTGVAQRAALQVRTPVVLPSPPPLPTRTPTRTATAVPPTVVPQRIHIVTEGDTLTYIATKYNTTVEAIMKANNMDDAHWLSIGQRLIIPP